MPMQRTQDSLTAPHPSRPGHHTGEYQPHINYEWFDP